MVIIQQKYYSAFCVKLDIALNGKSGTEFNFFFPPRVHDVTSK